MDENYMHPEIKDQAVIISENFQCLILNLSTCTIVIHIFWKFSKVKVNEPIKFYQIQHLKCNEQCIDTMQ